VITNGEPRSTLKVENDVAGMSIHDLIRTATRQLGASSRAVPNGYSIDLRNYDQGIITHIVLLKATIAGGGVSFKIINENIKDNSSVCTINLLNIAHLYVSWETHGMITFCYADEGRYKAINVTHDSGVMVQEDVEKRNEPEDGYELSEAQKRAQANRRTFYHIGRLFEKASVHNSDEPMEGSINA
jgi:hypothetical protein